MSLELKKKEVELMRVRTAKGEMELRIAERMDEIKRLEDSIIVQNQAEQKILEELKKIKGE